MVDKYLTRMFSLKEILRSRLFLNLHLTVPGELDYSLPRGYILKAGLYRIRFHDNPVFIP